MKTITMSSGREVFVDDTDHEWLSQHKWFEQKRRGSNALIARTHYTFDGTRIDYLMHRMIMNCPKHLEVDHINGNTLDNRRCNLRICTRSENQRNVDVRKDSKTKYKGVYFCKKRKKYIARIVLNGKRIWIGRYESKENAAIAYNEAAIKLFGGFARLNRVPQ